MFFLFYVILAFAKYCSFYKHTTDSKAPDGTMDEIRMGMPQGLQFGKKKHLEYPRSTGVVSTRKFNVFTCLKMLPV